MGTSVAELGVRIFLQDMSSSGFLGFEANIGKVGSSLHSLTARWENLSPVMKTISLLAAGSGVAFGIFGEALKFAVDSASDLEQAMTKIAIAFGLTQNQTEHFQATVIDLANHSIFSAMDVASGFEMMAEHGLKFKDATKEVGESLLNFATAIHTGTVPAAKLLSTTMQAFGIPMSEARHVTDLLTTSFYNGIPSVNDMNSALGTSGPMAHALGITLQDLLPWLDSLAQMSKSGATAGYELSNMLQALLNPTPKAQQELARLGVTILDQTNPAIYQLQAALARVTDHPYRFDGTITSLQEMYTQGRKLQVLHTDESFAEWAASAHILSDRLFDANGKFKGLGEFVRLLRDRFQELGLKGGDADKAISNLFNRTALKGADQFFNDIQGSLTKVDELQKKLATKGTAQAAADKQKNTKEGTWQQLSTTFRDLAAIAGGPFREDLKKLFTSLNGLLDLASKHPGAVKLVGQFLILATAISGVIFVVSLLVIGISAIGAPLLGGVFLVVAAIASIGLIGVTVKNRWAEISTWFSDLFAHFAHNIQVNVIESFRQGMGEIGAFFAKIPEQIQLRMLQVNEVIQSIGWKIRDGIKSALSGAWQWGSNFVKGLSDGIASGAHWVQEKIAGIVNLFNPLAHHSPPKEGPLKDDDTWMGNMMKMHAQEIHRHIPLVAAAAHLAASAIHSAFSTQHPLAFAHSTAMHPLAYQRPVNINLYIDSKQVESFLIKDLTRDLKLNGMNRMWK